MNKGKKSVKCSKCKNYFNRDEVIIYVYKISKDGRKVDYYNCNSCNTERCKNYRKTEGGKQVYREIMRRQYLKNPQKIIARSKLHYHLRVGNIIRPSECSKCEKECIPDGHHEDHSKALEVIWLCRQCHARHHKK